MCIVPSKDTQFPLTFHCDILMKGLDVTPKKQTIWNFYIFFQSDSDWIDSSTGICNIKIQSGIVFIQYEIPVLPG